MALTSLKSSSGRKDKSKSSKRKLEKRLQFHAKVQDASSSSLGAKKTIKKKKRVNRWQKKVKAYDLSALSEFLPELGSGQKKLVAETSQKKLNCKSRKKILQGERVRMSAVLNDEVFQTDPFAAIQRHLESTQPPSATTSHQQGTCHKQVKGKKKKKNKGKGKKNGSQSSMMDI